MLYRGKRHAATHVYKLHVILVTYLDRSLQPRKTYKRTRLWTKFFWRQSSSQRMEWQEHWTRWL